MRINYQQPVQAIAFSTGGTTGAPTKEEIRIEMDTNSVKLGEIHKINRLDPSNPLVVTQNAMTVGDVIVNITGDGVTTSTFTRV